MDAARTALIAVCSKNKYHGRFQLDVGKFEVAKTSMYQIGEFPSKKKQSHQQSCHDVVPF
jgi:hypothetical protein